MTIDDDAAVAFDRDGACVLRGVFADWVETLRAGVARTMADPSPDARVYDGGDGRFFGDYCNWQRITELRAFAFESAAGAVAAGLMGSQSVRLFHEHVLVKEPGADVPTPWHQDGPYYCVRGPKTCSLWIPLDPVPRERSVEFASGSHRGGTEYRPERFDGSPLVEGDDRPPVPTIDPRAVLSWSLEPGDAVAFQYMTLHGAPANTSTTTRRAVSLRVLGDGAVFVRRSGPTSPPFRHLEIVDGAPVDGPDFPLLPT